MDFDPLPIILGIAVFLGFILILLCIYAIKKALDIANQDKVIIFHGKVLLTEQQMKKGRVNALRSRNSQ